MGVKVISGAVVRSPRDISSALHCQLSCVEPVETNVNGSMPPAPGPVPSQNTNDGVDVPANAGCAGVGCTFAIRSNNTSVLQYPLNCVLLSSYSAKNENVLVFAAVVPMFVPEAIVKTSGVANVPDVAPPGPP